MRHLLLLRHDHAHLPHSDVTDGRERDVTGAEERQGAQHCPHVDDGEGGYHVCLRLVALLRHGRSRHTRKGLFFFVT